MKVECTIEETTVENDYGGDIPSVRVTCSRCGHSVVSYGRTSSSVKRCLVMLREQCPQDEENFYAAEEKEERPDWWSSAVPRGEEVTSPDILKNRPLKPPGRS